MTDRIRGSFTDQYAETKTVATELEYMAGQLIATEKGSAAEKEAGDTLREAYINAASNKKLAQENEDAIAKSKAPSETTVESALIVDSANGKSQDGPNTGCPQYALLHGKMIFDHLAKPNGVPAVWPKCEDGKLTRLEINVPYGYSYDGAYRGREIKIKP